MLVPVKEHRRYGVLQSKTFVSNDGPTEEVYFMSGGRPEK